MQKQSKELVLMYLQDVLDGLRVHQAVINKDGGDCHAWSQKLKLAKEFVEVSV